jgi:hypothetical protein
MAVVAERLLQFARRIEDTGGHGRCSIVVRRRPMMSKSKLVAVKLGASAVVAIMGLASPASAQMPANGIGRGALADPSSPHAFTLVDNPPNYGPQFYAPSQSGGGSIGYNELLMTHRLKKHPGKHRTK